MEPRASRPFMPRYGVVGPGEESGLLPWSWAEELLVGARYSWVATLWPDGRPHLTPVWGTWHDGAVWFSCSTGSRRPATSRRIPPRVVTTDDPARPVIVEGTAHGGPPAPRPSASPPRSRPKYETEISVEFVLEDALYRLAPTRVF